MICYKDMTFWNQRNSKRKVGTTGDMIQWLVEEVGFAKRDGCPKEANHLRQIADRLQAYKAENERLRGACTIVTERFGKIAGDGGTIQDFLTAGSMVEIQAALTGEGMNDV